MKLLLTGAQGQVGQEITALARAQGWELLAMDRATLDITQADRVREAIGGFMPRLVINAAAYTAVDLAESQTETAFAVNRDGTRHLAQSCAVANIPLLHLSTDYVFDGAKSTPYVENDPVSPLGVYGESKWAGEEALRANLSRHLIIRVSWVFGRHGKNFVKTILRLARERETIGVVADQRGGPTAAPDIAAMLLTLARQATDPAFDAWGTYHYRGDPPVSWHQFATTIVSEARQHTPLPLREIRAITTAEYPTPAKRPANSILDCQRMRSVLGIPLPDWRQATHTLMAQLLS
ncbi:MAG: dTDP-4-dehydrorhamnose reductase [Magnetococcales bacterium]|nr:dTDP-4-dehydrorhamnose reductase [Magnetococcales bacterium]